MKDQESSPAETMLQELIKEADALVENLENWTPNDELLTAISKEIPSNTMEWTDEEIHEKLSKIQQQYIVDAFQMPFINKLHDFQSYASTLSPKEFYRHYLEIGILTIQISQIVSKATQDLIFKCYLYQKIQKQGNSQYVDWLSPSIVGEG